MPPGPQERRAPDAMKMACPFCAHSESTVVRSRGSITIDKIHRRRECAGCGRRFPTSERVDRELLERERSDDTDRILPNPSPHTFEALRDAFRVLWDEAAGGTYSHARWQRASRLFTGPPPPAQP